MEMIPLFILAGIFYLIVISAIVQLLWNTTIPRNFDLRRITGGEAIRLTLLFWILFGSGSLLSFSYSG